MKTPPNRTAEIAYALGGEDSRAEVADMLARLPEQYHAIWVRTGIRLLNGVSAERSEELRLRDMAKVAEIQAFWGLGAFPYPDTESRVGCLRIAARSLYDLANDEEIIDNTEYVSANLFSIMLKITEAMCCHGPTSADATGGMS